MLPQPMSWSEPQEQDSNPLAQPDLALALEQQIDAGFPPGLALDLVLNELVVRAATATRARAAALALRRGEDMVCRAATGEHAPDLGIPLNTSDGLSGACLRTKKSQLCLDSETDPRVDAATCRRQGIRSLLIVPVLEGDDLVGVLEVFASDPAEFVDSDQNLLEIFARECARIRRAALEMEQRPKPAPQANEPELLLASALGPSSPPGRSPYESWTLLLGGLAIVLMIALGFLIGSRIGWLGASSPAGGNGSSPARTASSSSPGGPARPASKAAEPKRTPARTASPAENDGLVVYEQGKVVFRMKPAPSRPADDAVTPIETARVWLAADLAESRIVHRVEPQYPADAMAAHRSGDVVLEVVVGQDGSVTSARPLRGDPILTAAAADAVRNWRYEPYRVKGRPAEFQTDVTLKFSLPE